MTALISYDTLIAKLFSRQRLSCARNGLETCRTLSALVGDPHKNFPSIHIAGTNGKGSVAFKMAVALEAAGNKVGLFTSPHIRCFSERIRVNGEKVPEVFVEQHLSKLFDLAESQQLGVTFFDYVAQLAFEYFSQQQVDIAVIETGLGGRLDATNIIDPLLSVITSISLDHTQILGETIEAIATEKAGIIKPGKPVVIGPNVPLAPITDVATAEIYRVEVSAESFDDENRAIALKALEVSGLDHLSSATLVVPECRMECWELDGIPVVFDVAHNPDGLEHLFKSLRKAYPATRFRALFGIQEAKNVAGCRAVISRNTTSVLEVTPQPSKEASPQPQYDLRQVAQQAYRQAVDCGEGLLVCGSFYIMRDAKEAIVHNPSN